MNSAVLTKSAPLKHSCEYINTSTMQKGQAYLSLPLEEVSGEKVVSILETITLEPKMLLWFFCMHIS